MLDDEDDIKYQADVRQPKLHRIAGQSRPVGLQCAVDEKLQQAQDATTEVQEYLTNRPAHCGFAVEVRRRLWDVFEDREEEFDVGQAVDLVEVLANTTPL